MIDVNRRSAFSGDGGSPIGFILQINMLLRFRDDELSSPCPVEIQELLREFHHLLRTHCGRKDYWGEIK